jgi:hypothetical protein
MMRFLSMLRLRCSNYQAIQACIDINLAREPRSVPQLSHQIQHVQFAGSACTYSISPGRIDINMTGRAGAIAAAVAVDAVHSIIGGGSHERCTAGDFDGAALTAETYKRNFRHNHQGVIYVISKRSKHPPRCRGALNLARLASKSSLIGRSALLGILQNDAAPLIICNCPFFDLLQGSKTARAGKIVIQAAIANAWRPNGAINFTHCRVQLDLDYG